ncbi:AfsR/SARP family transcriptional regulator [Kribbella antibiotica]|uniref:AfsR/SARP family transcriptional regulator n=1 Tax=Kribbella antibiotica TaxID=190195 RepID=A0A4R4ZUM3_9ACTN|nr:BTAD domain-containing putative transcriptional regulator [Kribbella antibiotica]TDD62180.1 AfsR/SARP family transcriptional regulator [Kribbella antibiotica]
MQIGMLGSFVVRADDGVVVDVPGARLRGLLVALALEPGQVVPKARLVDWVWGEQPPAEAANALQRLVSRLRKVLPGGAIDGTPDGYRLVVEADAVDAVSFERLVGQGRLREALDLWRGAALQDVGLQDSTAFDAAVTRLEGLRLTAAEDWFDAEIGRGRGAQLVTELTDLVAAHPVRERLVGALLRALAASGRDAEALLVYERTRETLADELGVDPSPELAGLHVALLRGELGRREEAPKSNLRAELTSYVGKDDDVTAVAALVAGHRLTTLIGPGGSGKTRLAMETARALVNDLQGGARVVELAAIGAADDVAGAVLAGLGHRDALLGGAPEADAVDRVISAIRDRELLLILDNCEHVIESAAAFAHRVLGECRQLRILATSREPLGITGEALWAVAPLALPDEDADPAEIESSPAVRLLRDRASAVRKDLPTTDATLATMARVCRALDGMPLAIELAAARLRTMTLDQLAHRLDDLFRLLTGGSRTALPRHRTLRAVIDWSWELLSEPERTVLRRLSVFAGGASLEAAEHVCTGDALELLTALTEKSLVVAEGNDAPRYRMLGMVKEYAEQRLAEAGEAELARRSHLAYFTQLAETADPHLRRGEQLEWLAILEAEHDNITAAMRGALAAGEAEPAMRLAAGACWYWWLGGHRAEGSELLMAATAVPGEVADEIQAVVLSFVVGFMSSGRSDQFDAMEWIQRLFQLSHGIENKHPAVRFATALEGLLHDESAFMPAFESLLTDDDPWVAALAQLQLGKQRIHLGDGSRTADAHLEQAVADFRAVGERWGIAFALTELADRITVRGEFANAAEYYEQAADVVTEVGAIEDLLRMRARQAQLHWLAGDEAASQVAMTQAERVARQVALPEALAELTLAKAELARWRGDSEEARRQLDLATAGLPANSGHAGMRGAIDGILGYLTDDLDQARAYQAAVLEASADRSPLMVAQTLIGVADLAVRQEEFEQAARLLAASHKIRGLRDRSLPDIDRIEQTVRRRLGDTRFTEATAEGASADWRDLAAATLKITPAW